jgi:hypothetical protein
MRFLPFCRYFGFGVVAATLYNARSIYHLQREYSAELRQELDQLSRVEREIDRLLPRAKLAAGN